MRVVNALSTDLIKLAGLHISNRFTHAIFMIAIDPVLVNIRLVGAVRPSLHCVAAPLKKHCRCIFPDFAKRIGCIVADHIA